MKTLPNGKRKQVMVGEELAPVPSSRYTTEKAVRILNLYAQHPTMKAVAEAVMGDPAFGDKFSPQTIYTWMSEHADFSVKMREVKRARAFYFENKALEEAGDADEDNVQAQRLKIDTYKWAAGVNDPDTYGNKVKHSGDLDNPIGFIVETGIDRAQPSVPIPATTPPGEAK